MDEENNNSTLTPEAAANGELDTVRPVQPTSPPVVSEPVLPRSPEVPATDQIPVADSAPSVSVGEVKIDEPAVASVVNDAPPKTGGKKRLAVIIGVVAAVLLFAAVLLYFLWYQNKNKIVTDALTQAFHAESVTFELEGQISAQSFEWEDTYAGSSYQYQANLAVSGGTSPDGANLDVTFEIKSSSGGNTSSFGQKVKVAVLSAANGDLFIKPEGLQEIITNLSGGFGPDGSAAQRLYDFADRLEGRWIKIAAEDLESYSPEYSEAQRCLTDLQTKYSRDPAVRSELIQAYKEQPFIVVGDSLGEKDGSVGYDITFDRDQSEKFGEKLAQLAVVKDLRQCLGGSDLIDDLDEEVTEQPDNTKLEIWANSFTHELTELKITGGDDYHISLSLKLKFNQPVEVSVPGEARPISEVAEEFNAILSDLYAPTPPYDFEEEIFEDGLDSDFEVIEEYDFYY